MRAPNPLPVAVLASGRGSNLQALHQASLHGGLPIRVAGVFSDKADCGAMAYARRHGITHRAFSATEHPSREAFDRALMSALADVRPELIVCAGYMRIISDTGIALAPCPMINIHPSLLPLYPGLHTHARAIADGRLEHGASVHLVNNILDGGRVLSQAKVPVLAGDSPALLAERVLSREYPLLVETVRSIIGGRIVLNHAAQAQVLYLQDDNARLD
jgi:phosphoribosylglycinamide formyltransferase 1